MSSAGPVIGKEDQFERQYTERFRALVSDHGLFVQYEQDRAALDLGVHLTRPAGEQQRVSHARIWFQLKGIHATTLSPEEYHRATSVSFSLPLQHLKFWFASPEPVCLALYVEAADQFVVEDVMEIVYRRWGEKFLSPSTFAAEQKEVTVTLHTRSVLTPELLDDMRRHQSIRIDGPFFRGRPLGHRLDPLRCVPERFEPATYVRLIQRLLAVHDYRATEVLEPTTLLVGDDAPPDHAVLSVGRLYNTFEWVPQLFNEFGVGPEDDFRIEGAPQIVHGRTAVLIHGDPGLSPDTDRLDYFARTLCAKEVHQILVFLNTEEIACFGHFRGGLRNSGLDCLPQLLGDLAFSLLTATAVYLEFREAISWKVVNYLTDLRATSKK